MGKSAEGGSEIRRTRLKLHPPGGGMNMYLLISRVSNHLRSTDTEKALKARVQRDRS